MFLFLLLAESPGFNQNQDPLIDPIFAQELGITEPQPSFSATKTFYGPSLTDFNFYTPDDGTAELADPLTIQHNFVFRTPVTFLPKVQFSIKPAFLTHLKNKKKDDTIIDQIEFLNTTFDLSKELFDNNKVSYSAKAGVVVPTSLTSLKAQSYIYPILGHSFTYKGIKKFIFNIENSFSFFLFKNESLKKNYLSTVLELNLAFQAFKKVAFKTTYETKFHSNEKDNYLSITNNAYHLIHLGVLVTYFDSLSLYPFLTLNPKNNFKNPALNFMISKKFF